MIFYLKCKRGLGLLPYVAIHSQALPVDLLPRGTLFNSFPFILLTLSGCRYVFTLTRLLFPELEQSLSCTETFMSFNSRGYGTRRLRGEQARAPACHFTLL